MPGSPTCIEISEFAELGFSGIRSCSSTNLKDLQVNCHIFVRIRSSELSYVVLDNSILGFLDIDTLTDNFLVKFKNKISAVAH